MSSPSPSSGQGEPEERRRSMRVPLEMALHLVVEGQEHAARTVLGNRQGVLVYSPKLCARGSVIEVRNPASGRSSRVRVAWAWVEGSGEAKTIRLALENTDGSRGAWEEEYDARLRDEEAGASDRRRGSRQSVEFELDVAYEGRTGRAMTLDVSDEGACIVSHEPYAPGAVLHVVRSDAQREADFRVVWTRSVASLFEDVPRPDRYRVGLALVQSEPDFWSPQPDAAASRPSSGLPGQVRLSEVPVVRGAPVERP